MPVPTFNESTKAEKLPMEVFRWLKEASIHVRTNPESLEDIYDSLKLLLRLLAVRNPESQSHATRQALGSLVESICSLPDSETVILDLLALLIRMVDAKKLHRYNPMKHLAIAGLGHLSKFLSVHMKQMSANVFIISLDSLTICPSGPETSRYRNTLLWAMTQSATSAVNEATLKQACRTARSIIENAKTTDLDAVAKRRSFELFAALLSQPAAKGLGDKFKSYHRMFLDYGISSPDETVRFASAEFFSVTIVSLSPKPIQQELDAIVGAMVKLRESKSYGVDPVTSAKLDGYSVLLMNLVKRRTVHADFESEFESWIAPLILQLDPFSSKKLLIDGVFNHRLNNGHTEVGMIAVFLRQLALSRMKVATSGAKSKPRSSPLPLTESILACLTGIVHVLGSSVQPLSASIYQAVLGLILNGSEPLSDEQLGWAILCLLEIVKARPSLLSTSIQECLEQLNIPTQSSRCAEIAYLVSALTIETKNHPLYGDLDLNRQIYLLGYKKVKERNDLNSYKLGWSLISATLCFCSEAVRPLIPQMLPLWEAHISSSTFEYPEFVERALSAMAIFLEHNPSLLTPDVSGRLAEILYNTWFFAEKKSGMALLRMRLLECYDQLLQNGNLSKCPSGLLMRYVSHFADPHSYAMIDELGWERTSTSKPRPSEDLLGSGKASSLYILEWHNAIENGLLGFDGDSRVAVSNDLDHIIFGLQSNNVEAFSAKKAPHDAFTRIITLAISVVAKLLPSQPIRIQESVLNTIFTHLESAADCRSPRKIAITVNIAHFMVQTLSGGFSSDVRVLNIIISIVEQLLSHNHNLVREQGAKSCGLLAEKLKGDVNGTNTLGSLIKQIFDSCVSAESSASTRGGSILALGYIAQARPQHAFYDALYRTLMALAADPDPRIHIPVVVSMNRSLSTVESIDQKYVRYAFKTITLTYLLESHGNDIAFEREFANGLAQVLSRLGPILSTDQQKSNRDLVVCFADQLQNSNDSQVRVTAWKCYIEVYYYARQSVLWPELIRKWRDIITHLDSSEEEIDAAINGLLLLTRISARSILSVAGDGFQDALWLLMDKKPTHLELRSLLMSWLDQTADEKDSVSRWIQVLSDVVMKPRRFFLDRLSRQTSPPKPKFISADQLKKAATTPTAMAADEDVALEVQSDEGNNDHFSWEARKFALDMLLYLLRQDLNGKNENEKFSSSTTRMIGDIIRISFSSSTSQIIGLQYGGLSLLKEIISRLSNVADPDFPQISLLAQYQVQIISALSPAFDRDSSPGLAMIALHVCSTFFTSEIIKSRDKLSKLMRIFEDSLVSISTETFRLGTLEMSSDASRVLKVALLGLWAQVYISSKTRLHLAEIIENFPQLPELWTGALYEYERMESALASEWSSASLSTAVEQMTDIQFRHLMEPVFEASWLGFVRALSIAAKDSKVTLVLGGLCFQSLTKMLQVVKPSPSEVNSSLLATSNLSISLVEDTTYELASTMEDFRAIDKLTVLEVLNDILAEQSYQQIIHAEDHYFDQMISVLYRAMLVGQPSEQMAVLKIANSLVRGQPETDDSVDHFFELLKISIVPLRQMFPHLFDQASGEHEMSLRKIDAEKIDLLRFTMNSVIDIAQVFREVIQIDLWVCLLKVFEELNHFEPILVAPSFKRLLEVLATQVESRGVTFVVGALTLSLKRAVEKESPAASLLVSAAIVCTNSRSLFSTMALSYVKQFGARAADSLLQGTSAEADEKSQSLALTAMQCITAVFRTCGYNPVGGAFAYSSIPSLVVLVCKQELRETEFGTNLVKQAAAALSIFAALDGTYQAYAVVLPSLLSVRALNIRNLLLQLAVKNPSSFKKGVWSMSTEDRDLLQSILAQNDDEDSLESPTSLDASDNEGDEIELKSFA